MRSTKERVFSLLLALVLIVGLLPVGLLDRLKEKYYGQ